MLAVHNRGNFLAGRGNMHFKDVTASAPWTASDLDKFAYAGLCAFVVALSSGGDGFAVGGLILANWIALVPVGFLMFRILLVKQVRPPCPIHILLLAFTALVALSLIWTVDSDSTITRLRTYTQMLVFVGLIWELAPTKARVQGLLVSYVLGSGIASLTTIYNYLTGQSTAQLSGAQWDTDRYSVEGINADELALIIALGIPIALYLVIAQKKKLTSALCWVQIIIGFTAILLTGTRGALFALAVGVVMMSGPTLSRMSWAQRGIAALACVALALCTLYFIPQTSLDRYLSAGTELTEGTLTHRTVIWAAGLQVFREHSFLGVGAGAYGSAVVRIIDIPYIAHNTFLSVLVELGVVGASLLALLLASLAYSAFRLPYLEKRIWLALLGTWVIGASSMTWENRKTTWLLFGLIAAQAYARETRGFRLRREELPPVSEALGGALRPAPSPPALTAEGTIRCQ
jgi:O-antigen ligase